MIAAELAQRYAQGESLATLALEYQLCKRTVARRVRAMGGEIRPPGLHVHPISREQASAAQLKAREARRAPGIYCKRCEILLRFDPGQDGYCGECWEEVR